MPFSQREKDDDADGVAEQLEKEMRMDLPRADREPDREGHETGSLTPELDTRVKTRSLPLQGVDAALIANPEFVGTSILHTHKFLINAPDWAAADLAICPAPAVEKACDLPMRFALADEDRGWRNDGESNGQRERRIGRIK